MSAEVLLSRLEGVRETGSDRGLARCPAHKDRSPSLSFRLMDDGRLLLHCFAGCETADVLSALGLQMADLFPKGALGDFAPSRSRIPASDLLKVISEDVSLVGTLAAAFLAEHSLNERGWKLLAEASARIGRARDHVR